MEPIFQERCFRLLFFASTTKEKTKIISFSTIKKSAKRQLQRCPSTIFGPSMKKIPKSLTRSLKKRLNP